jgi:hypothetical protein
LRVCRQAYAFIVEEAGEVVDGEAASEERDDKLAVAFGLAVEEVALAFCLLALFGFLQAAAFLGGLHLSGIIDRSACHGNSPVRRRAILPVAWEKGCASVLRTAPRNFENFSLAVRILPCVARRPLPPSFRSPRATVLLPP